MYCAHYPQTERPQKSKWRIIWYHVDCAMCMACQNVQKACNSNNSKLVLQPLFPEKPGWASTRTMSRFVAPGVEAYNSQRANPVKFTGSHAGKQHCMNGGTRSEREQVDSDPEILCGIHFLSEPSQLPLASDEHQSISILFMYLWCGCRRPSQLPLASDEHQSIPFMYLWCGCRRRAITGMYKIMCA